MGVGTKRVLEIFRREKSLFESKYPWVRYAELRVSNRRCVPSSPCRGRDVVWCNPDTGTIWVLRRLAELPETNVVGVIRHELGHLSDLRWTEKNAEIRADRVAKSVTGYPVRYDTKGLQTTRLGSKRPDWLPK